MYKILQFVGHEDHGSFIILQKFKDSFLHQMITEVDVECWEWIILQDLREKHRYQLIWQTNDFLNLKCFYTYSLLKMFSPEYVCNQLV